MASASALVDAHGNRADRADHKQDPEDGPEARRSVGLAKQARGDGVVGGAEGKVALRLGGGGDPVENALIGTAAISAGGLIAGVGRKRITARWLHRRFADRAFVRFVAGAGAALGIGLASHVSGRLLLGVGAGLRSWATLRTRAASARGRRRVLIDPGALCRGRAGAPQSER